MKKRRDAERAKLLRPSTSHLTTGYDGDAAAYRPLSAGRVRASACRVLKPQPPVVRDDTQVFRRRADEEPTTADKKTNNLRSPLELAETAKQSPSLSDNTHRLYIQTARITTGQSYGKRNETRIPVPPLTDRLDQTNNSGRPLSATLDYQSQPTPPSTPPPAVHFSMTIGTQGWLNGIREKVSESIFVDNINDSSSPFSFINSVRLSTEEVETFIYANQHPETSDPYQLIVVPHSHINRNLYYVFSARGVTRHVDDKAVSFCSLKEWMISYKAFKLTHSITFFSQYKKWRIFSHWKTSVRSGTIQATKEYLLDNHILLHPVLAEPLLKIRKVCGQIAVMSITSVLQHTSTPSQFIKLQLDQRKQCVASFKSKLSVIDSLTRQACKDTFKVVLEERIQAKTSPAGTPTSAAKSLKRDDDDLYVGPTHTELSQARGMCRKLFGFIKVIDLMLTDSLLDFSTRSLTGLQNMLQDPDEEVIPIGDDTNPDEVLYEMMIASDIIDENDILKAKRQARKTSKTGNRIHPAGIPIRILEALGIPNPSYKPVLSCQLRLTSSLDLEISPTPSEIKQQIISTALASIKEVLSAFKPLYSPSNLRGLIGETNKSILATIHKELPEEESVTLTKSILSNKKLKDVEALIGLGLDRSADKLHEFSHNYRCFITMFAENENLSPDQIIASEPPVSYYSNLLRELKSQKRSIENIKPLESSGVYSIDLSLFRDVLLPSPQQARMKIISVLPIIFKKRNDALLVSLQDGVAKLTADIDSVHAMAALIKYHEKISLKLEDYNSQYNILSEHLELLQTNNIEIPPEIIGAWFHGTVPALQELGRCVVVTEQTREEKISQFAETIEAGLQECEDEILELEIEADNPLIFEEDSEPSLVLEHLSELTEKLVALEIKERELCSHQEIFGLEQNSHPKLPIVAKNISDKKKIWASLTEWVAIRSDYDTLNYMESSLQDVTDTVHKYSRIVNQAARTFPNNTVVLKLRMLIDEIRIVLPVVQCLQNENLLPQHFELIHAIVGSSTFTTYGHLVDIAIVDVKEDVLQISITATEEAKLYSELQTLSKGWQSVEFEMRSHDHPAAKDMYVIGDTSYITQHLEDNIVAMSTISGNRYCPPSLRDKSTKWAAELHTILTRLAKWKICQESWLYLFTVFSSHNLCRHWPQNAKNFGTTDKQLRERMKKLHEAPYVHRSVLSDVIFSHLDLVQRDLDQLLSVLATNIDEKRMCHPRYYFLSDTQLIDFLSNAKDPLAVVHYFPALFQSIINITIEEGGISSVCSGDGECLQLPRGLRVTNDSNRWIDRLGETISTTLRKHARAVATFLGQMAPGVVPRIDHSLPYPTQILCAIHDAVWADLITKAINNVNETTSSLLSEDDNQNILSSLFEGCIVEFHRLSSLVKKSNHTATSRIRLSALIFRLSSHKRVVENLLEYGVGTSAAFFEWDRQLKCSWSVPDQGICYTVLNHTFKYGYEFQGASKRSVITATTDKAFLLITQAQQSYRNVLLSGPSGTGKTEIVKELSVTLARHCLMVNASQSLTTSVVDKWISGLCQTGAWGCLSNLTALPTKVLSILAQQLSSIRTAMIAAANGDTLVKRIEPVSHIGSFKVQANFSLFATSTSFISSASLPAAMKNCFRTFSCMSPDIMAILQITLFATDMPIERANTLSKKIFQLFEQLKSQLVPQDQYTNAFSFHLMTGIINSICVVGGTITDTEVAKKCKEAIIPKLITDDVHVLDEILTNLFSGGITVSLQSDSPSGDVMSTKVKELHQILSSSRSVIILGSSGCGKSLIVKQWSEKNGSKCHVFSPQSMSVKDLLGTSLRADHKTALWTNGIVTDTVLQAHSKNLPTSIIFDGCISKDWCDTMRVLFAKERYYTSADHTFSISDAITIIVETTSIADLPPSMLSLCKVLYMPDGNPFNLSKKWNETTLLPVLKAIFPKEVAIAVNNHVGGLFSSYLEMLTRQIRTYSTCSANACVAMGNALKIMNALLSEAWSSEDTERGLYSKFSSVQIENMISKGKTISSMLFSYSILWGFGGTIYSETERESFSNFVKIEMSKLLPNVNTNTQSLFDLKPDFSQLRFVKWDTCSLHQSDGKRPLKITESPFVDTVDTMKYSFITKLLLLNGTHVAVTGPSGVGKSSLLKHCLQGTGIIHQAIYSPSTTLLNARQLLHGSLVKSDRKEGNSLPVLIYIDNMNLCQGIGVHESLRYFIEHKSVYHLKQLHTSANTKGKVTVSCCINSNAVPPEERLSRLLTTVFMNIPTEEGISTVVSRILSGYYIAQRFSQEVCDTATRVIPQACADLLTSVSLKFTPSNSHPHYVFSMRSIVSLLHGMCQVVPRTCATTKSLLSLWVHEACRVFQDRLISEIEKNTFTSIVSKTLLRCAPTGSWKQESVGSQNWCSFLRPTGDPDATERVYELLNEQQQNQLPELINYYATDLYDTGMELVFFKDCCEHILRILRVLQQRRQQLLLLGTSGCGRQTLSRLASFILEYECLSLDVDDCYATESFHTDMAQLYETAAIHKNHVVLLLGDKQFRIPDIGSAINYILLGEFNIPGLFSQEEQARHDWDNYLSCAADHIHIVLSMTPGNNFRKMTREFPSLVTCCTINYFVTWPHEALMEVVTRKIDKQQFKVTDLSIFPKAHNHAVLIALQSRKELEDQSSFQNTPNVTPSVFFDFLSLYTGIYNERITSFEAQESKLTTAIEIVKGAKAVVEEMNTKVSSTDGDLTIINNGISELNDSITIQLSAIQEVRNLIIRFENELHEQKTLHMAASHELEQSLPVIAQAMRGIDSLSKQDVVEIRSYSSAPRSVLLTAEAVLILLNEKKSGEWQTARQIMAKSDFLHRLQNFDKSAMTNESVSKLERIIKDDEFSPEKVGLTGSYACRSMCVWVRMMYKYFYADKKATPKRERVFELENIMSSIQEQLDSSLSDQRSKVLELESLQKRLQQLEMQHSSHSNSMSHIKTRLNTAVELCNLLADDVDGWTAESIEIRTQISICMQTSFIAAARIAYSGPFSPRHRKILESNLVDLLVDHVGDNYQSHKDFIKYLKTSPNLGVSSLISKATLREWKLTKLPTDYDTIEGISILYWCCKASYSKRWPLVIDPHSQIQQWLHETFSKDGLKTLSLPGSSDSVESHKRFIQQIEIAVEGGNPLVVDRVESSIDNSLLPILNKKIETIPVHERDSSGHQYRLLLHTDSSIIYNPDFKLILMSSNQSVPLDPDVWVVSNVISFGVTNTNLQHLLVSDLLGNGQMDAEEATRSALSTVMNSKRQLASYENQVLSALQSNKATVLDDGTIVKNLQKLRQTSIFIKKQVVEAEAKSVEISNTHADYLKIAERGAMFFTVLQKLQEIDSSYTFSLSSVNECLSSYVLNLGLDQPVGQLLEKATELLFSFASCAIRREHFPVFACYFTIKISSSNGNAPPNSWEILSSDLPDLVNSTTPLEKPSAADWITDRQWQALQPNEDTSSSNLCDVILQRCDVWKQWASDLKIHNSDPMPEGNITNWEKLLLTKILKPKCFYEASLTFVKSVLGEKYIQHITPTAIEETIFSWTTTTSPLLLMLHEGGIGDNTISTIAELRNKEHQVVSHSYAGVVTAADIISEVDRSRKSGECLFLHDIHMASSSVISALSSTVLHSLVSSHPQFRLVLIYSYSSSNQINIPQELIRECVKVHCEPQVGIKSLMKSEFLARCSEDNTDSRGPSYCLSMFHAVTLERIRLKYLNWNSSNIFVSENSLEHAVMMLDALLIKSQEPQADDFSLLRSSILDAYYGGLGASQFNYRTLKCLLRRFINPCTSIEGSSLATHSDRYTVPVAWGAPALYSDVIDGLPDDDTSAILGVGDCALDSIHEEMSISLFKMMNSISCSSTVFINIFELSCPGVIHVEGSLFGGHSLSEVLSQEIKSSNKLVSIVSSSLKTLTDNSKLPSSSSDDNHTLYDVLRSGRVPSKWLRHSFETNSQNDILKWMSEFNNKVSFIRRWVSSRSAKLELFNLGGLFHPKVFLSTARLDFAASQGTPLSSVVLTFAVDPDNSKRSSYSYNLSGLRCDCCSWDSIAQSLASEKRGSPKPDFPVLTLNFTDASSWHVSHGRNISVPLYSHSGRSESSFIAEVNLPCSTDADQLVEAGAALISM